MLHIALCDDNPASIEILEKYFDILNDSTIDYDVYFTNHLLEIIMFLILFIPLRSNAGGFHTKKKLTCYCFSNLMLLAIVYIPNLIISKTAYGIIAILFVLSNLLILCLAPIPNFNRIFDPSEKIVFKRRTHYVLLIEFCFVIFTSFFNFDYWSKLYMLVPIVVAFLLIIGFLKAVYLLAAPFPYFEVLQLSFQLPRIMGTFYHLSHRKANFDIPFSPVLLKSAS